MNPKTFFLSICCTATLFSLPSTRAANQSPVEPYVLHLGLTDEDKASLDTPLKKGEECYDETDNGYSLSHQVSTGEARNGDRIISGYDYEAQYAPDWYTRLSKHATLEVTLERGQDLIIEADLVDKLISLGYSSGEQASIDEYAYNKSLCIYNHNWCFTPLVLEKITSAPFALHYKNFYQISGQHIQDIYFTLYYPLYIPAHSKLVEKIENLHIHLK